MNESNLNNTSRTNWQALESMSDEDIDYSDIPPLTEDFFANATLRIPAQKAQNFIELEPEIMQWLRSKSQKPNEIVNTVLRQYIQEQA